MILRTSEETLGKTWIEESESLNPGFNVSCNREHWFEVSETLNPGFSGSAPPQSDSGIGLLDILCVTKHASNPSSQWTSGIQVILASSSSESPTTTF